jgi:hypothetical protein
MSGQFDPFSPPALTSGWAASLPAFFVAVLGQAGSTIAHSGCPNEIAHTWLDAPTDTPTDTSCLDEMDLRFTTEAQPLAGPLKVARVGVGRLSPGTGVNKPAARGVSGSRSDASPRTPRRLISRCGPTAGHLEPYRRHDDLLAELLSRPMRDGSFVRTGGEREPKPERVSGQHLVKEPNEPDSTRRYSCDTRNRVRPAKPLVRDSLLRSLTRNRSSTSSR